MLMKNRDNKSLTRTLLLSLGIPIIFIPGLILASVLGWNWQKDLAKLKDFRKAKEIFPTTAVISKVLDGDTLELDNGMTLRLIGIDAPNRGEEKYEEVSEYVRDLIEDEKVEIEYDYYQDDKFGRLLGYVFEKCVSSFGCKNGKRMVNWLLVKKDMAKVVIYEDRRQLKYEKELQEAEMQ